MLPHVWDRGLGLKRRKLPSLQDTVSLEVALLPVISDIAGMHVPSFLPAKPIMTVRWAKT